jgi:hypothetical protein
LIFNDLRERGARIYNLLIFNDLAIYKVAESFGGVAPASVIGSRFPCPHLRLQFLDTSSGFVEYLLLVGAWAVLQEADKI